MTLRQQSPSQQLPTLPPYFTNQFEVTMAEASQPAAAVSQPRTALPSRPLSRGREESAATSSSRPSPDGEKQRRPLKSGSRSPSATSAAEPSTKGAGTKKKQQPASSSGHSQVCRYATPVINAKNFKADPPTATVERQKRRYGEDPRKVLQYATLVVSI